MKTLPTREEVERLLDTKFKDWSAGDMHRMLDAASALVEIIDIVGIGTSDGVCTGDVVGAVSNLNNLGKTLARMMDPPKDVDRAKRSVGVLVGMTCLPAIKGEGYVSLPCDRVQEVLAYVTSLEAEIVRRDESFETWVTTLREAEDKKAALEAELTQVRGELTAERNARRVVDGNVQEQAQRASDAEERVAALEAEIAETRNWGLIAGRASQLIGERTAALEAELAETRENSAEYRTTSEMAATNLNVTLAERDAARDQLRRVEKERDDRLAQLTSAEARIEGLQAAYDDLRTNHKQAVEEREAWRSEAIEYRDKLAEYRAQPPELAQTLLQWLTEQESKTIQVQCDGETSRFTVAGAFYSLETARDVEDADAEDGVLATLVDVLELALKENLKTRKDNEAAAKRGGED